ncbi:MAG TPA: TIGR00366 family protein [Pseudothermotoga sp.]
MFWKFAKKFQFAAEKIIPDSFVFCIILTIVVYVLGLILTKSSPLQLVVYWYNGLWTMISFAFQMSFMVVVCGAAARAPQVKKFLTWLAKLPKSPSAAMVLLLIFGLLTSVINWAFSLIITPILAMQLSKNVKGLHFPLMIASGYAVMCLGQSLCPAASVYALLATKGHFMEKTLGIMTQDITTFNPVNVVTWIVLSVFTIIVIGFLTKPSPNEIVEYHGETEGQTILTGEEKEKTIAEAMNGSKILMILIGISGIISIIYSFVKKGFLGSLDFNFIIFIFLTLNCFLYNTPKKFVKAIEESMKPAAQVMLQFPFYGGIMGIMSSSGLTAILANALAKISTAATFPAVSYLSAAFINLFVPSQGGQWAVQGPVLVEASKQIGAHLPTVINAFVYGDEVTNLIQPLYVIPVLSLVNMKLKHVWGFMAFICVLWMIVTTICLLILPGLML